MAIPKQIEYGDSCIEEGDVCPEAPVSDCSGALEIAYEGSCSCMVSRMPPCSRCENSFLACTTCPFDSRDL